MSRTQNFKLPFTTALSQLDPEAIVSSLTPGTVIHVAVHDQPIAGEEPARFLFGVLADELKDLEISEETLTEDAAFILFAATVGGKQAQALLHIRRSGDVISELTVFLRPLAALQEVSDRVGSRMAERFGPLDEPA